jgi:hypothetical protein
MAPKGPQIDPFRSKDDRKYSPKIRLLCLISKKMLIHGLKMQRDAVAIVLPAILVCLLIFLTFTRFFITHDYKLSIGITFDLVFTVPLFHILLSKRNNNLKYSAALFFTVGILIAGIIIPKNDQFLLHGIRLWVVPAIEFCGIAFFAVKTKKILTRHREPGNVKGDFYTTFKTVANEVLPKRLASIVSGEISVFYYSFFNWQKPVFDNKNFSYHKKTGILMLIGVFIFMILVEATVFHLLLARWSAKAAWSLSAISLYAAIQAFGVARSISKRPIQIIGHRLIIRYGILAETTINLNDVLSVGMTNKPLIINENSKYLSPFKKIEEPNIVIQVNKLHYIEGIYGSKKLFDTLLINVDEKESFVAQMQLLLNPAS